MVHLEAGYEVPLRNDGDMVARMEKILMELSHNRDRLERLRRQGMIYVRKCPPQDAKPQAVARVLNWAEPETRCRVAQDAAPTANRRQNRRSADCEYIAEARAD
jgi:hypothetical protein